MSDLPLLPMSIAHCLRSSILCPLINLTWLWVLPPTPAFGGVLWSEQFDDAGAPGRWTVEGDWGIGPVTGGPGSAVSASGAAATSLAGDAAPGTVRRISSVGGIVIPASSVSPRLRFRHWHLFSSGSHGRIQVRAAGAEWADLGAAPVDGRSVGWEWACLPLGDHAGQTVEIGFLCETGDGPAAPGWYLDDLEVVDGPESDYAAWQAAYFPQAHPDPAKEANLWGDDADPDGDGCPNLLEFMMRRNPVMPDAELGPAIRIEGGDLVIAFRETTSPVHGLSWLGFWSNDLAVSHPGGIRYATVAEHTGHRIVEASIARNREEKMFFHLKAWRD